MLRRLSVLFLAALFVTPFFVKADDDSRLERWKNEGLVFAVRDSETKEFVRWGRISLDTWKGEEESSWVVRTEDGRLRTGYRGRVENWETTSGEQAKRLVVRNSKGHFVTWTPFEQDLREQWENDETNGWRYVVRHRASGRFVNVAKGELEVWKNWKNPVLVVRDSADGERNGQLVTFLPGRTETGRDGVTRIAYRVPAGQPEGGQFITTVLVVEAEGD
ncbi:MAG TPA: hypothetical protein VJB34_10025 [Bdellovibrionota bacterium]|nr:hypothetical protein [Bdellovibrionota bacterium]